MARFSCISFVAKFSVEKTMNNRNVIVFPFHKTHGAFITSNHGWSTISTNRHAIRPLKLMFFKEEIHFLEYFFYCGIFSKWTAKQKLLNEIICVKISHKHQELCITSDICCLIQLQTKSFTVSYGSDCLLQNISSEFFDTPLHGVV